MSAFEQWFEEWWDKFGQFEFSTYLTKDQSKFVWDAALVWIYHKVKASGDPWSMFQMIFDELNEMEGIK